MKTLLANAPVLSAAQVPSADMAFDEYMASIVAQLPTNAGLSMLQGPQNSQVSFFFKNSADGAINSNFYNDLLAPRYEGRGTYNGVDQVATASSMFSSAYQQLYLSLRYQLSSKDLAAYQLAQAAVNTDMRGLVGPWNKWVAAVGANLTPPPPKLDDTDMESALATLTFYMFNTWLSDSFKAKVKADPDYPYQHMNNFNQIFGEMPMGMPGTILTSITVVFQALASAGGLIAKMSNGTQYIEGIRNNLLNPKKENGGMTLEGSPNMVPGWTFTPNDPSKLVGILASTPPRGKLTYSAHVARTATNTLSVHASTGAGISIPVLDFFSIGVQGGASAGIMNQSFAGSSFDIEVVFNNPTVQPVLSMEPMLYDPATQMGWMDVNPIKEAIANGSNSDVTGFVFSGGVPKFNFGKGGDLGYINSAVVSQFMQLRLTFNNCTTSSVQSFFDTHLKTTVSFLGIPLGGASSSTHASHSYENVTANSVTVVIEPNPPGYLPGSANINDSLCALVAVGVTYPFA